MQPTHWNFWHLLPQFLYSQVNFNDKDRFSPVEKTVLVIANQPLPHNFLIVWEKASLRVCADGGANRLFDFISPENREFFLPHYIKGDFDSIRVEVLEFYKCKGVQIQCDRSQDTTDLEKVMQLFEESEVNRVIKDSLLVVLGGLGGNLSQELANFNCMFQHRFKIIFASDVNIVFLLKEGHHVIHCLPNLKCGLIPLGGPCEDITTEGLKWNLHNSRLQFGSLISSSNCTLDYSVHIQTSDPILWTFDFADGLSKFGNTFSYKECSPLSSHKRDRKTFF
jgi:thiamine pyrophosphokinase